jgi:hypothetical protein
MGAQMGRLTGSARVAVRPSQTYGRRRDRVPPAGTV